MLKDDVNEVSDVDDQHYHTTDMNLIRSPLSASES